MRLLCRCFYNHLKCNHISKKLSLLAMKKLVDLVCGCSFLTFAKENWLGAWGESQGGQVGGWKMRVMSAKARMVAVKRKEEVRGNLNIWLNIYFIYIYIVNKKMNRMWSSGMAATCNFVFGIYKHSRILKAPRNPAESKIVFSPTFLRVIYPLSPLFRNHLLMSPMK